VEIDVVFSTTHNFIYHHARENSLHSVLEAAVATSSILSGDILLLRDRYAGEPDRDFDREGLREM
jgi:hypothetical protein